jgi:hypothetical protein
MAGPLSPSLDGMRFDNDECREFIEMAIVGGYGDRRSLTDLGHPGDPSATKRVCTSFVADSTSVDNSRSAGNCASDREKATPRGRTL